MIVNLLFRLLFFNKDNNKFLESVNQRKIKENFLSSYMKKTYDVYDVMLVCVSVPFTMSNTKRKYKFRILKNKIVKKTKRKIENSIKRFKIITRRRMFRKNKRKNNNKRNEKIFVVCYFRNNTNKKNLEFFSVWINY